jgi:hypothetical protein
MPEWYSYDLIDALAVYLVYAVIFIVVITLGLILQLIQYIWQRITR